MPDWLWPTTRCVGAQIPTPGCPDGKKIRGDPRRAFRGESRGAVRETRAVGAEGWSAKHRAIRSSEVTRKTPNNAQPKGGPRDPRSTEPRNDPRDLDNAQPRSDPQYPSSAELRSNPRNPSSAHRGDQWHTVGTGAGPFPLLSDPPRSVSPESFSLGLSALVCLPPVP